MCRRLVALNSECDIPVKPEACHAAPKRGIQ
jgi:hypothetical protein